MAKIRVWIPDGETCDCCRFNPKGTVWCELFAIYLRETDDYESKLKCNSCLAMMEEEE